MIKFYIPEKIGLRESGEFKPGVWVNMTAPDEAEIKRICSLTGCDEDFFLSAVDRYETPFFVESPNGTKYIVTDSPYADISKGYMKYHTMPLGILIAKDCIVTVAHEENAVIAAYEKGEVFDFSADDKPGFVTGLILENLLLFRKYLRDIENRVENIEAELNESMKNKELIQLMNMEKSLIYFRHSLESNLESFKKMGTSEFFNSPKDMKMWTIIIKECRQAANMAGIYLEILSKTMGAFESVISNNLSMVMKLLTSVTVIMSIPAIISGFYGMNVSLPYANASHAFYWIVGINAFVCALVALYMLRKRLF